MRKHDDSTHASAFGLNVTLKRDICCTRVRSTLLNVCQFRHVYFQYHARVRIRFKLAACLGESWTGMEGFHMGCPLSMMFIVALFLPWCRYLGELPDVSPQLYADNLKCVSTMPEQLLRAAQFTSTYVKLVEQEPAPSKRILMSTSAVVRQEMREWVISDQERWTVKLDVRDLGGHLDTTYRAWGRTLVAGVLAVLRGCLAGPLLYRWIIGVSFVFSAPSMFLLLCMVLRLLISPRAISCN